MCVHAEGWGGGRSSVFMRRLSIVVCLFIAGCNQLQQFDSVIENVPVSPFSGRESHSPATPHHILYQSQQTWCQFNAHFPSVLPPMLFSRIHVIAFGSSIHRGFIIAHGKLAIRSNLPLPPPSPRLLNCYKWTNVSTGTTFLLIKIRLISSRLCHYIRSAYI